MLRASTPADRDFLMGVFESTRIDEFRAAGLDVQASRDLLAQQFSMQDAYYRRHYPNGRFDIVLEALVRMLRQQHLFVAAGARDTARLSAAADAGKLSHAMWLLKHYLMIRIPLWRPMPFLRRASSTSPITRRSGSRSRCAL